jgi:uncharacterized phage protein (TIGR01671 family)
MQREIKFRIWIPKFNSFLKNYNNSDEIGIRTVGVFNNLYNLPYMPSDEYVAQQYTGLKDKNGVEIYEGDIIRCKSFDGWFDKIGYYHNMEVKYQTLESGDSELSGFLYINIDREVVGNIFENNELLKA